MRAHTRMIRAGRVPVCMGTALRGGAERGTVEVRRKETTAMPIATVNPANGETLRTFDALDEQETGRRLAG